MNLSGVFRSIVASKKLVTTHMTMGMTTNPTKKIKLGSRKR